MATIVISLVNVDTNETYTAVINKENNLYTFTHMVKDEFSDNFTTTAIKKSEFIKMLGPGDYSTHINIENGTDVEMNIIPSMIASFNNVIRTGIAINYILGLPDLNEEEEK